MAENKTQMTEQSVDSYLAAIEDENRRKDCETLTRLMSQATHQPPKMWGTSIVGFGRYHYKYESGREGDSMLAGFASRKGDIALYLSNNFPEREELLNQLGKYKAGKGCLYIRRMEDVDPAVLERLVALAAEARKQH